MANILLSLEKGEIHAYQSIYAQKKDGEVAHVAKGTPTRH
jgi:hypothetical protein